MNADTRIYVAGSNTFLGGALANGLRELGYRHVFADTPAADLSRKADVDRAFEVAAPEIVIHAAGRSGGIQANIDFPADLIRDNFLVNTNVIDGAYRFGASKLLYLASSCCYPRECAQPMSERALGSGLLEPTNAAYASAKLGGIALCEAYRQQHGLSSLSLIPSNVYGAGEDRDAASGHVVGALMARFEDAKTSGRESVRVWGSGTPRRDFLYIDDFVEACVFCLENDIETKAINIGSGEGVSIRKLGETIAGAVGFEGAIEFDRTRPDGMPVKVLDIERMHGLGWRPRTPLTKGIAAMWERTRTETKLLQDAVG